MKITSTEDWRQYLEAWTSCMMDTYWFTGNRFFDYNREEITDELRGDWEAGNSVFLVAQSEEDAAGCLGVKIKGMSAVLRRWEPAVPARFRASGVGEMLLGEAEDRAIEAGVGTLSATLRYPYVMEKPWLGALYESMDFRDVRPGIQMLARIGTRTPEPQREYETAPCNRFSLDQLTEFTLRAFTSTPKDMAIHGDDPAISQPEAARRAIEHQMAGGLGDSPEELNMIAFVDGEPAGFTRGIIIEDRYKPRYGLLAVLGVFPEHREKGVGYYLASELMDRFRARGLEYAFVGTPWNDHGAQRLYARAGFRPIHRISFYRKPLG